MLSFVYELPYKIKVFKKTEKLADSAHSSLQRRFVQINNDENEDDAGDSNDAVVNDGLWSKFKGSGYFSIEGHGSRRPVLK
jgi:hypothetical protein